MRLKADEILSRLGFKIGEQGLEINPHDAFLYQNALQLYGKAMSINLDKIQDDEIRRRFSGMAFLAGDQGQAKRFLSNLKNSTQTTREYLAAILNNIYTPVE